MPFKDPIRRVAYEKEYKLLNPEILRKGWKKYSNKIKVEAFSKFGSKCKKCGFEDLRALQLDHINGGGAKERRSTKLVGHRLYKAIVFGKRKIDDLQILCANCNQIKKMENKEFN